MAGRKARHFRFREPVSLQHAEALARIAQFPLADPAAALGAGLALINADFPELLLPHARRLAARPAHVARLTQRPAYLSAKAVDDALIAAAQPA